MLGRRNQSGLTDEQIESCQQAWEFLCGDNPPVLDASEAHLYGSRTRFLAHTNTVMLGADVDPGEGMSANSRLSRLACLAHEIAHTERIEYIRPFEPPDNYIDEAETSLRASFILGISPKDREDLIEDARDRLVDWLALLGERINETN